MNKNADNIYRFFKRLLDLLLSGLVLLVLLPLFIPIIVALRLTAEGEVFYFQKRIGQYRKYFNIWKFATMQKASPGMGTGMITLRNDPRVTPVGRWLRKTKINELPQVINVLIGNLSLVGPRPLVDATFSTYSEEVQAVIYEVKPGITGIGSIVFRDEEKMISASELPALEYYRLHIAPYKGALELWYHDHASFSTDLLIIFLTAWHVFFPHSDWVFRVFKDLPSKPDVLKMEERVF